MVGPTMMEEMESRTRIAQAMAVVITPILLVTFCIGLYQWFQLPDYEETSPRGRRVSVVLVIDGDTFTATDTAGEDLGRLRVLGVDAPEMARDDDQAGECHAIEATEAAERMLKDATVTITHDPTQGKRDRYGRSLVYVDVAGHDFARDMLDQGNAALYQESTTLDRYDTYRDSERAAQEEALGLWGNCS